MRACGGGVVLMYVDESIGGRALAYVSACAYMSLICVCLYKPKVSHLSACAYISQ